MPNHVSHKLTFRHNDDNWKEKKAEFDKVLEFMKTEDTDFDFGALIPYPKQYADADKARRDAEAEMEKSGKVDWSKLPKDGYNQGGYEWCIANWGTKWNAYTLNVDWDEVTFQTAWSYPTPIFEALSKKFPEVVFEIEYADEDSGRNCGKTAWQNGVEIERMDENTDPSYPWYEFANRLYYEVELRRERKENSELREQIKKLKGENA